MAASSLQALRPRDTSAAAISSSLQRMADALAELRAEMAAIQGNRRSLLVGGSNADLDRADGRIKTLQTEVERIELAVEVLKPDLAVARGREQIERIRVVEAQARDAAEEFRAFWSRRYEALAREIASGVELERAARNIRRFYAQIVQDAERDPDVTAAGGLPPVEMPPLPCGYVGAEAKSPLALVCLPAVTPGQAIAWPSRDSSKIGEAAAYAP